MNVKFLFSCLIILCVILNVLYSDNDYNFDFIKHGGLIIYDNNSVRTQIPQYKGMIYSECDIIEKNFICGVIETNLKTIYKELYLFDKKNGKIKSIYKFDENIDIVNAKLIEKLNTVIISYGNKNNKKNKFTSIIVNLLTNKKSIFNNTQLLNMPWVIPGEFYKSKISEDDSLILLRGMYKNEYGTIVLDVLNQTIVNFISDIEINSTKYTPYLIAISKNYYIIGVLNMQESDKLNYSYYIYKNNQKIKIFNDDRLYSCILDEQNDNIYLLKIRHIKKGKSYEKWVDDYLYKINLKNFSEIKFKKIKTQKYDELKFNKKANTIDLGNSNIINLHD